MALTLNQFIGMETGGLEEFESTSGSPDATESIIVRSGGRSLAMPDAASTNARSNLFDEVAKDSGTGCIFGIGFYLVASTGASLKFCNIQNGAGAELCSMEITSSDTVRVVDSLNTAQITSSAVSIGSWHYAEVYFENTATGAAELFIDGVSEGTDPSADYDNGTLTLMEIRASSTQTGIHYYDDFYFLSGATASSDRLGPGVSVLGFGPGKASATPDYNETGAASNAADVLDIGQWDDGSLVPWGDTAQVQEYTDTPQSGGAVACNDAAGSAGQGPSGGDKIVSGTIKGAKWGFRADRSGGGGTTQSIVYGSDDAGTFTAGTGSPATVTLGSGTFTNHFVVLEPADAGVPTSTETFAIGFANDGGRDFELISYQCFLLHVNNIPAVVDLDDGVMPEFPSHGLTVEV